MSEERTYHPQLPCSSEPVYCSAGRWIAIKDEAGIDHIYYVKKVERLWTKEFGPGTKCEDGSRRRFEPETVQTNGQNPCLLHIDGQPHPWYFNSGWERIRVVSTGGSYFDGG